MVPIGLAWRNARPLNEVIEFLAAEDKPPASPDDVLRGLHSDSWACDQSKSVDDLLRTYDDGDALQYLGNEFIATVTKRVLILTLYVRWSCLEIPEHRLEVEGLAIRAMDFFGASEVALFQGDSSYPDLACDMRWGFDELRNQLVTDRCGHPSDPLIWGRADLPTITAEQLSRRYRRRRITEVAGAVTILILTGLAVWGLIWLSGIGNGGRP